MIRLAPAKLIILEESSNFPHDISELSVVIDVVRVIQSISLGWRFCVRTAMHVFVFGCNVT